MSKSMLNPIETIVEIYATGDVAFLSGPWAHICENRGFTQNSRNFFVLIWHRCFFGCRCASTHFLTVVESALLPWTAYYTVKKYCGAGVLTFSEFLVCSLHHHHPDLISHRHHQIIIIITDHRPHQSSLITNGSLHHLIIITIMRLWSWLAAAALQRVRAMEHTIFPVCHHSFLR